MLFPLCYIFNIFPSTLNYYFKRQNTHNFNIIYSKASLIWPISLMKTLGFAKLIIGCEVLS